MVGTSLALLCPPYYCALVGVVKRELPFAASLNHWDEVTAYVALCALGTGIVQHL